MKPLIRKSWYTLTDAADYLTRNTESGTISASDVLQLATEGMLELSFRMVSATWAETGELVWLQDKADALTPEDQAEFIFHPLATTSSEHINLEETQLVGDQADSPLRFIPDKTENQGVHPGFIWILTGYGWGEGLQDKLWSHSLNVSPNEINRPVRLLSSLPATISKYTFKEPEKELFFLPYPEDADDEQWVMKIRWDNLPDDTLIGVTREALDNLLTDETSPKPSEHPDTNTAELRRAQRTLAALATGLARKYPTYKNGNKPNASQLAKLATEHLRDATSDRTPHGFSETSARQTITEALKACPDLTGI